MSRGICDDCGEVNSVDLPGMWDASDFTGNGDNR